MARNIYTAKDKATVMKLLAKGEISHRQISERTGVGRMTVKRWAADKYKSPAVTKKRREGAGPVLAPGIDLFIRRAA